MGINGIHHLAICTKDIKAQIEFFTDVLGARLVALYWMHGVEGAWHGFLELNEHCSLAFVQTPGIENIERTIGVTHAGWGGGDNAGGGMQHVAFNVADEAQLLTMRDRIRSRGLNVYGPIDHGMCKSIYFAGLEDLTLEVAISEQPIDGRAWIDPEVVALAGIDADELAGFREPAAYAGAGGAVVQPAVDPDKPHPRGMNEDAYRKILEVPDEILSAPNRFSNPPVDITE